MDVLLQNRGRFVAFLRSSPGLDADFEDVLHDAFVKSLEPQGCLRDADKAVAWFFRVLRNQLVDRHRRAGRHRRAVELLRCQLEGADYSGAPSESAHLFEELLQRLAPRHRETLQALCSTGGSLGALAAREGTTKNHAAVRAHRARQALRKLCSESGVGARSS